MSNKELSDKQKRQIRFCANKIIEKGLDTTWNGNFIIGLKEKELLNELSNWIDVTKITQYAKEIYQVIAKDERVADIEYNEDEQEFDIVFYTDYIPNYDNNEEAQQLWEYTVIFKDNTDGHKRYNGEFIHEDKSEADNVFELYKNDVEQYYAKEWIKYCEDEDWIENDVEVIYSDITKEDV